MSDAFPFAAEIVDSSMTLKVGWIWIDGLKEDDEAE
jgi:hypothetical protein